MHSNTSPIWHAYCTTGFMLALLVALFIGGTAHLYALEVDEAGRYHVSEEELDNVAAGVSLHEPSPLDIDQRIILWDEAVKESERRKSSTVPRIEVSF